MNSENVRVGANFDERRSRLIVEQSRSLKSRDVDDERTRRDENDGKFSTSKKFGDVCRTDESVCPTPNFMGI